jgi:hypothetical protein
LPCLEALVQMSSPKILCSFAIVFTLILVGCGGGGVQPIHITPDFSVNISSAQAWTGGASGESTIVVAIGSVAGFSNPVTLSITGTNFPAGVTGSFGQTGDQTTVTPPGQATFTITSTNGKPPDGNYPFSIVGTSGSLTHSTSTSLFVPGPVKMESLVPPGAMEGPDGGAIQHYIQNNPVVTGGTFQVEWSSIDQGPSAGANQYNWSYNDGLIQAWITAGRKANIVFWANSDDPTTTCVGNNWSQYGQDGTGNCAIPSYVWTALGSSNFATCTPPNASGPQQIPNYFDSAFQTNYKAFIKAALAHYGSNFGSNIGYIRFGLGRGGETLPVGDWDSGDACSAKFAGWGLTDSTITTTWEPYLQTMLDFEANNNPSNVQLMAGMTPMNGNGVPIFVAATVVPLKIGIGSQGLSKSDINNCDGSAADWCNLFSLYTGLVPLELQTVGQSCTDNSCTTGSLDNVLPWAVDNKATIVELYYQDWLTAFDSSFSPYDSSKGYANAITNAATGQ